MENTVNSLLPVWACLASLLAVPLIAAGGALLWAGKAAWYS